MTPQGPPDKIKKLYNFLAENPESKSTFGPLGIAKFKSQLNGNQEGLDAIANFAVSKGFSKNLESFYADYDQPEAYMPPIKPAVSLAPPKSTNLESIAASDVAGRPIEVEKRSLAPDVPWYEKAGQNISSYFSDISKSVQRGIAQGAAIQTVPMTDLARGKVPVDDPRVFEDMARANKEVESFGNTAVEADFQTSEGIWDDITDYAKITPLVVGESLATLIRSGYDEAIAGGSSGAAAGSVIPGLGTAAGLSTGLQAGTGVAAYNMELYASIMDGLREKGVDVTNGDQLRKAFQNEALMTGILSDANKRAAIIGTTDLIAGVAGGRMLSAMKKGATNRLAREAAGAIPDVAGGAGGEALAQLATKGVINPQEVALEALGEAPIIGAIRKAPELAGFGQKAQEAVAEAQSPIEEEVAVSKEEYQAFRDKGEIDPDRIAGIQSDIDAGADLAQMEPQYQEIAAAAIEQGLVNPKETPVISVDETAEESSVVPDPGSQVEPSVLPSDIDAASGVVAPESGGSAVQGEGVSIESQGVSEEVVEETQEAPSAPQPVAQQEPAAAAAPGEDLPEPGAKMLEGPPKVFYGRARFAPDYKDERKYKIQGIDLPLVYVRFGALPRDEKGNVTKSAAYNKGAKMQEEDGVSVYEAGYDKESDRYILSSPGQLASGVANLIGRRAYLVEGKEIGHRGSDFEPVLDPGSVRVIGEISSDKILDENLISDGIDANGNEISYSFPKSSIANELREKIANKETQKAEAIAYAKEVGADYSKTIARMDGEIAELEAQIAELATESPTAKESVAESPALSEGSEVELPPQFQGGSPRRMVFSGGQWQQNVGGQLTDVGQPVQDQAQQAFDLKAQEGTPATSQQAEVEVEVEANPEGAIRKAINNLRSLLDETEGAAGLNLETYRALIKAAIKVLEASDYALNEAEALAMAIKEEGIKGLEGIQEAYEKALSKIGGKSDSQSSEPPPPSKPTPDEPEGPRKVLKTIEGQRIQPSTTLDPIKKVLQEKGLYREVMDMDELFEKAASFVNEVGEAKAEREADDRNNPAPVAIAIYSELMGRNQEAMNSGNLSPEEYADAYQRQGDLLAKVGGMGTEGGRVGAAIDKMYRSLGELAGLDFSYESQKRLISHIFGADSITPAVDAKLRKAEAKYLEAEKRNKELQQKLADLEAKEAVAAIREAETRNTQKPQKKLGDAVTQLAKRIRGDIKRPSVFQSASPGQIAWDVAKEAAATTLEAVGATLNAAEAIAKAVQSGLGALRKTDWYKGLDADTKKKAEGEFRKAMAAADVPEATVVNGNVSVPNALIKHYVVNEKMTEIDEISDRILADIKESNPEFEGTTRDVRDAISGYAKKVNPTKKQIAQEAKDIQDQILELKSLGKMISALEDIQANIARTKNENKKRELTEREKALKERIKQAEASLKIEKSPEQKRLESLRKKLDDLLMGIVPDSRTKTDDTQAIKDLKDQIFQQKQLMGLVAGKRLESEIKRDNALRAIEKAIANLNAKIAASDFSKTPNAEQTDPEILAAKEALRVKKEEYQALKDSTGESAREKLAAFKKRASEMKAEYDRRMQAVLDGSYRKPSRNMLALDKEAQEIENEKFKAKELFDIAYRKAQDASTNPVAKAWYKFSDLTNFFKQIMAGVVDLGVLAIQGKALAIRYPGQVPKAMTALVKGAASEENYNKILADIKSTPMYRLLRKSGLDIVDPHSDAFITEVGSGSFAEEVVDFFAELPAKGLEKVGLPEAAGKAQKVGRAINIIKKLNRAQTAYMNVMRFSVFSMAAQRLMQDGYTFENNPDMFKGLADSINTLSGRARLLGAERSRLAMSILNIAFFAPRNLASVLLTSTPAALGYMIYNNRGRKGLISEGNKIFLTTLLADYASTAAFMLALKGLAGWDNDEEDDDEISVGLDPVSTNFMKLKVGNQVYDPWSGKQSSAVLQSRLISAILDADYSMRSATTGIKTQIGGPEQDDPTYSDVVGRYFSGKMNPLTRSAIDAAGSKASKMFPDVRMLQGRVFDPITSELVTPMTIPAIEATLDNPEASPFLNAFLIPSLIVGAGHTDLNPDPENYTPGQALKEKLHPEEVIRKQHERSFKRALKQGNLSEARKQYEKATTTGDMAGKELTQKEREKAAYEILDGLSKTGVAGAYGVDMASEIKLARYVFDYYPGKDSEAEKQAIRDKYRESFKDLAALSEDNKVTIRESFKMKGREMDNAVKTMQAIIPYPEGKKSKTWAEYAQKSIPWYRAYKKSSLK